MRTLSRRRLTKTIGATAAAAGMGLPLLGHRRARAAATYDFVDIGEMQPDAASTVMALVPTALNARGDVIGSMWVSDTKNSPYIYSKGKLRKIKTGKFGARVVDINDDGVLVGRELTGWMDDGTALGRIAIWVDREIELLPDPEGLWAEVVNGIAVGINNRGQVAGNCFLADGSIVPVLWTNGEPEILANVAGLPRQEARALNEDGVVGGIVYNEDGSSSPVYWRDGVGNYLTSADVNLPVGFIQAQGMSLDGSFLGAVWSDGANQPAAWTVDQLSVLSPVSGAYDNIVVEGGIDQRTFVGSVALDKSVASYRALIWQFSSPTDLNELVDLESGVTLIRGVKINAEGQIIGGALWPDGSLHGFLLNPR